MQIYLYFIKLSCRSIDEEGATTRSPGPFSFLTLRPRVRDVVGVLHERNVGILLCVGQGCMPQAFRDRHDVGAALQHVGGERMPQAVPSDLWFDAGKL
jgi:hypothetical protein